MPKRYSRQLKVTPDPTMMGNAENQIRRWFGLSTPGGYTNEVARLIKDFQHNHGLWVDGIVGPKTWAKLYEVFGSTPSVPIDPLEDEDFERDWSEDADIDPVQPDPAYDYDWSEDDRTEPYPEHEPEHWSDVIPPIGWAFFAICGGLILALTLGAI